MLCRFLLHLDGPPSARAARNSIDLYGPDLANRAHIAPSLSSELHAAHPSGSLVEVQGGSVDRAAGLESKGFLMSSVTACLPASRSLPVRTRP